MKIAKADCEIIDQLDGKSILKKLELCGRTCYKSESKITEGSAEQFVRNIIKRGHESVLEHVSFTVRFICDRGVMAEITRHRIASFSVESSRFCNYSNDRFGNEITVIEPCFMKCGDNGYGVWHSFCEEAEETYFELLKRGRTPQEARSVLPNSLKTEIIMTANLREWRTVLKLRTSHSAHPQCREVFMILLEKVHEQIPVVFDDILDEVHKDG